MVICYPADDQHVIDCAEAEAGAYPASIYAMGWRAAEKRHGILVECANCEATIKPGEGFGSGSAVPPGMVCSRACFVAYQDRCKAAAEVAP